MKVVDVLSKFFMMVGILAVVAVGLYMIAKQINKYKPPKKPDDPNDPYMIHIGAVCPTGWDIENTNDGVTCTDNTKQNLYNGCKKKETFQKLRKKDWQHFVNTGKPTGSMRKRCDFVTNCDGNANNNNNNRYNSWIGVSNKC